jgi:predicted lipoprotein with Yx(FWY)xxD motif
VRGEVTLLVVVGLVALVGCGDDDAGPSTTAAPKRETSKTRAADQDTAAEKGKGATITLGDSSFGSMLFDSNDQAIYVFEEDPRGRSACYGECAEAWPPVFTDGEPRARSGVRESLLGTVKRRGGRMQVTYAGRPLYFYAHEAPGEVRCHNVDLNGGFWWVIGPDGRRRP